MIPKIMRSKKAISPILATLLLIVIAVAAIVVTYAWIMTYMTGAGEQAGVMLYKANVNFYTNGTGRIDIEIGNSGTADTQIIRVYVGTSTSTLQSQSTAPSLPVSLNGGSIVKVTVAYSWTAGQTYHFRIVSSTGQTIDFPEEAPQ